MPHHPLVLGSQLHMYTTSNQRQVWAHVSGIAAASLTGKPTPNDPVAKSSRNHAINAAKTGSYRELPKACCAHATPAPIHPVRRALPCSHQECQSARAAMISSKRLHTAHTCVLLQLHIGSRLAGHEWRPSRLSTTTRSDSRCWCNTRQRLVAFQHWCLPMP